MKKVFALSLILLILLSSGPLLLEAQTNAFQGSQAGGSAGGAPTVGKLIGAGLKILNLLISFAIGLAMVVFLFALVKYVTAGSGEEKASARTLMIYGIIALFVAVSVWGLVKFIQVATGINGQEEVNAPSLPTF
jgi:hypothetical protein